MGFYKNHHLAIQSKKSEDRDEELQEIIKKLASALGAKNDHELLAKLKITQQDLGRWKRGNMPDHLRIILEKFLS